MYINPVVHRQNLYPCTTHRHGTNFEKELGGGGEFYYISPYTFLVHISLCSCSQREPNFAREAQHSGLDSSGERSESSESLPVSEARGGDNENLLVRDEEETENTGGGRRKRRRGRGKRERSKTVTKPTGEQDIFVLT